jgi:hypothetical protein
MKSCTRLALVAAEMALFAVACSSKSSPPAGHAPSNNAGAGAGSGTGGRAGGGGQTGAGGSGNAAAGTESCTTKTGYEQVAALDSDWLADSADVSMAIDGDGSPMVAWVAFDISATTLYFTAYEPTTCQWSSPVSVDALGGVSPADDREVTMTRDASDGHLGIAYQVVDSASNRTLMLAQSDDDGATWSKETVVQSPPGDTIRGVERPTVVIRNGITYFAYYQFYLYSWAGNNSSNNSGFVLLTRTDNSGSFTSVNIPPVDGAALPGSEQYPPSLAVDDAGEAGLAYFALTDDAATNLQLNYFHTEQGKSVAVFDSQHKPNYDADVSLVFEGNRPRLAASLDRDGNDGGTNDTGSTIWFSGSDDGTVWFTPVELPMDGSDAMGPDVALATGGDGKLSIASNFSGATGNHKCGAPKISTSSNDGTSWVTCGPSTSGAELLSHAGSFVQLAYQPSGKRIAAFSAQGQGVWVWREP